MARTSAALGKCWCGVTRVLESTCQVGWGYCYICTVLCTNCLWQEYLCKTVWWRIWAHFVALCHWQECASHHLPCSLCCLSSSQQLLDLRCQHCGHPLAMSTIWCSVLVLGLQNYLGWVAAGATTGCGQSPDRWVLLTATVSHTHLTSKLQHSPDGAQKIPTQGAQMLLTTSLTCHADVCTALSFLTEAISAGFFRAVWTSWWYSYLGIFFWNQGLSAEHLLTFEEMQGERFCLRNSKCCITGSYNWNSFLQAAHDLYEIMNNWRMIVSSKGNSCCRDAHLLSRLWLAGFRRGSKILDTQEEDNYGPHSFLSSVLVYAELWDQGNCQEHFYRHWRWVIEVTKKYSLKTQ